MPCVTRALVRCEVQGYQRVCVGVGLQYYIAAMSAVTTIGTASRDKLLSTKGGSSIAAVSGLSVDGHRVYEFTGF